MQPLIAPKSFPEYSPEEYHAYVTGMYGLRQRGSKPKKEELVAGISLMRTKKGSISVRRMKQKRAFAWITREEIRTLSAGLGLDLHECWNAFVEREFMIVETRMEAERRYAELKGVPF